MRLIRGIALGFGIALFGALVGAGCASHKVVTRIDTNEQVDLSGRWNDTDSQMVAEEMIKDMLGSPWLERRADRSKTPVIICGSVMNKSLEHIPVATFVKDIEKAVVNSAQAQIVASSEERGDVRTEREDQRVNASPETLKQMGREVGADYMLLGEINQINDKEEKNEVKYYQVDLTLVNIETNIKSWIGQKKIKKFIGRSKYRS